MFRAKYCTDTNAWKPSSNSLKPISVTFEQLFLTITRVFYYSISYLEMKRETFSKEVAMFFISFFFLEKFKQGKKNYFRKAFSLFSETFFDFWTKEITFFSLSLFKIFSIFNQSSEFLIFLEFWVEKFSRKKWKVFFYRRHGLCIPV